MPDSAVAITAGTGTNIDTFTNSAGDHRQVVVVGNKGAHEGFASTFRTPGIAGTAGQKIFALHNSTTSTVVVDVKSLRVTKTETVVIAVTVLPPLIRAWKFTAVPTNGTALTKVARDTGATATNAQLTAWQGASADGTASATALTITLPAATIVNSVFADRLITAVGSDNAVVWELIPPNTSVVLRPLEGICVFLDYTVATQNAVTDMWSVSCNWEEYVA
jgi:hypothetical protein